MKSRLRLLYSFLFGLSIISLSMISGCGSTVPSEAVLAGDWALATTTETNLPPTVLSFDSDGNLTKITFTINNGSVEYTPTSTTSTVVENEVTVSVTINSGTLSFSGLLNDADTLATGNLTAQLVLSSITINLTGAEATLTKQ